MTSIEYVMLEYPFKKASLISCFCSRQFGLKDNYIKNLSCCSSCCESCWNEEVEFIGEVAE